MADIALGDFDGNGKSDVCAAIRMWPQLGMLDAQW
jgi:hypothetical protein